MPYDDVEYRRMVAQMKVYRKANLTKEGDENVASETREKGTEFNFFVNDGIVYTRMAQFKSEEAKELYIKAQEADKRLLTLSRLLEGKRREFFFAELSEEQDALRSEILELEVEVRKYKKIVDEYILQTRHEEIKKLKNTEN